MARIDQQVVTRARLNRGSVVHGVPDAARDHVLAVVERAALERYGGLDVPGPAPARFECRQPDGGLVPDPEASETESQSRRRPLLPVLDGLVGLVDALLLDPGHAAPPLPIMRQSSALLTTRLRSPAPGLPRPRRPRRARLGPGPRSRPASGTRRLPWPVRPSGH